MADAAPHDAAPHAAPHTATPVLHAGEAIDGSDVLQPLAQAPGALLAAVRMVATDIDGTMTRAGRLCPRVLAAAADLAAAGIEVLPVSGRPAGEVLGLARYFPGVRRALAENGLVAIVPDHGVFPRGRAPDRARLEQVAALICADQAPLRPAEDAFCRLCDLAFLREGRSDAALAELQLRAARHDVYLLFSNVHVHLSLDAPDKGAAVLALCAADGVDPGAVAAIGDAPNDVGFWRPGRFGLAVGCAQVAAQRAVIAHLPTWQVAEAADGWLELAAALLASRR